MKKRKLLLAVALPAVAGFGLLGAKVTSAHGLVGPFANADPEQIANWHQSMFQHEAQLLGISIDEVKAAWAAGKDLVELAEEHGISKEQLKTKMEEARKAHMKSQLQALVEKGVITQDQADARLESLEAEHDKRGMGMKKSGFFGF